MIKNGFLILENDIIRVSSISRIGFKPSKRQLNTHTYEWETTPSEYDFWVDGFRFKVPKSVYIQVKEEFIENSKLKLKEREFYGK